MEGVGVMAETAWSLVPPVITIVLALVTKEVYMSLAIGIFIGAFMFTGFNFLGAIDTMFDIMSNKVGGNVNILVFLVLLGIIVSAIQKSGASQAYGNYAARKINGKRSALLVTFFLGLLIFIDDYFNCLTVGTVMRPVTDKFKITRAKLAYIIDATAAPICIIAPVSSWAAAVSSSLPENSGIDGFSLFLHTIPLNLYAWLTIIFMLFIIFLNKDFSRMAAFEKESGSTLVIPAEYADDESTAPVGNGRIMDLVLPLLVLIGSCVFGMLYTGGILEGKSIIDAITYSCLNYAILGPFIYMMLFSKKWEFICSFFTFLFYSFILIIFPAFLAWLWLKLRSMEFFQKNAPHPTLRAWDYVFGKRKEYFVIVTLVDGREIAGEYSTESFTSSYPEEPQIYLEKTWKLDENGDFEREINQTSGILVLSKDIQSIEFFEKN